MSDNDVKSSHLSESPEAQACGEYRSVSGLALFGLFLGLLSPLALTGPSGWLIPAAAIIICLAALWRIRLKDETMIGRKAAVFGLLLAVLCGTTAISQWFATRWIVEHQARGIATAWFELLADDQPLKAHQLSLIPGERKPLDASLLHVYQRGPKRREELDKFLAEPLVRSILALGKKADIRFYECGGIWGPPGKENVQEIYSISFEDKQGKKKTFFATVLLRRFPPDQAEKINWVVASSEGGVRPPWISEEEAKKYSDEEVDL
ncbi:MAG: hypothetical protein U9N87_01135 [Planctomycetota bacterium]|nr:hypothetical protein [Planctomycetota bacterium]